MTFVLVAWIEVGYIGHRTEPDAAVIYLKILFFLNLVLNVMLLRGLYIYAFRTELSLHKLGNLNIPIFHLTKIKAWFSSETKYLYV